MSSLEKKVAQSFIDIADAIETGNFGKKVRVGLTLFGSEHGVEELVKGAHLAASDLFEIVLIGPEVETHLENVVVASEEEQYDKMEELLGSGYISSCVTLHYNFPIGVSTVGRVITPALGKEMFIATTTGTSATTRTEAMFKNALYGISAAKACGVKNPTVGILNVDNARGVERHLQQLKTNGYDINFAQSQRSDGGVVMRGNDLMLGSVDVMVCDSLTGNILMKLFSAFSSGGNIETLGYGYGPGIGFDYDKCVCIISRASGASVISKAIVYAYELAAGDVINVVKEEKSKADAAGYEKIYEEIKASSAPKAAVSKPKVEVAKEVVSFDISGIDIMDLDNAVDVLLSNQIYAESGMGCTGPIVLVSEANSKKAMEILAKEGYTSSDAPSC
ncbi:MAG: glycine/sarcosine/betaine reductase complex component C subunit alpha [Bacilli bacterium]